MRVGYGYDVHRLKRNRKLTLCGVLIPYKYGLMGHSDADVAIHALMDALLGATSLKDIGNLFPDSDVKYKNISSITLLNQVVKIIHDKGFKIINIDLTIVAQNPKLSPYINEMKENIKHTLNLSANDIGIKATTEEGMGLTGKNKAMLAHCVVLVD